MEGRFGTALSMGPVIEAIEVSSEDLVFAPAGFETSGYDHFPDLCSQIPCFGRGRDFDQLLGDGGGSRGDLSILNILEESPSYRKIIDARMLKESFVFGSESGLDEMIGDFVKRSGSMAKEVGPGKISQLPPVPVQQNGVRFWWALKCFGEWSDKEENRKRQQDGENARDGWDQRRKT